MIVAVPDTPGHPPLPATLTEATELGTATEARLLPGPGATRAAVTDALPSCRWAHFACHAHTARSTGEFVGESIHLGSAFHLVGFRHVIATLWQVHDQTAAQITRTFYAGYGSDDTALA